MNMSYKIYAHVSHIFSCCCRASYLSSAITSEKKEKNYNDVVNKMVYESEGEILLKRS
jgi:hypothetical protein